MQEIDISMNITIIANGEFPSGEWVEGLLRGADRIVCCDGAAQKYLCWHHRYAPGETGRAVMVGDADSQPEDLVATAREEGVALERVVVAEQDYNDLTKATRYALQHWGGGDTEVTYIGATGLREDHTLGNISLLAWYLEQWPGVRFRMLSDYGEFRPMEGRAVFGSKAGQQVSLFSLTPEVPVSVKGLRWPIEERRLRWWWEGSLNEALGEEFEVQGGVIVVYLLTASKA